MAASKYATWDDREIGDIERDVARFLADEARHGGIFVKSSRIAHEFEDVSTHRVGQAIGKLAEEWSTLSIERWSGESAGAVTWHVEHDGPSPFGTECQHCQTLIGDAVNECPHCGQEVGR